MQTILNGRWYDLGGCAIFDAPPSDYRIKPEPSYRPWKDEEIPMGALIKPIDKSLNWVDTILFRSDGRIRGTAVCFYAEFALSNHLHSTDGGKTWKTCGVLIEE